MCHPASRGTRILGCVASTHRAGGIDTHPTIRTFPAMQRLRLCLSLLQVTYVRSSETQNIFPANTPLTLQPSFQYTYSGGKPTTLPTADACVVSRWDASQPCHRACHPQAVKVYPRLRQPSAAYSAHTSPWLPKWYTLASCMVPENDTNRGLARFALPRPPVAILRPLSLDASTMHIGGVHQSPSVRQRGVHTPRRLQPGHQGQQCPVKGCAQPGL